ncbi:MAG TPA: peptidoglycan DD-metalloendopeptidase family protein [Rhodanobacteraceae bacterium]|nr:peptidoglycan DD-metalloendopeptidase family protein [Rhodanobacteraceae bacterium]
MTARHALRLVLPVSLLLGACASQPPAPVVDLTHPAQAARAPAPAPPPTMAIVQKGDSLYAIAMRHNLDWRDLAQWNGITPPYILQPGMRVRLTKPPGFKPPPPSAPEEDAELTTQPLVATTVEGPGAAAATSAPGAAASPPPSTSPPAAPSPAAATPAPGVAPSTPASGAIPKLPARSVAGIRWSWPAEGKVMQGYAAGDPTRQGIDIAGHRGAPVRAAADGVVVYSGNGLVGYGELIIVKHSDAFLSAYGHNDKRLVHEGDHVRAGQQIAEMGSSGTSQVELHFEIRKQGKPVDPTAFLPAR